MTGIQVGGLASGLDTQSIIDQLMSVERQPRTRMGYQQTAAQARQDALQAVDTKLSALKLAANDLHSALLWVPVQSTTSSNTAVLTARTTGAAAPGASVVGVTNLPSAEQHSFGQAFESLLDPITHSGDGLLDQRIASSTRQLNTIKDNLDELDRRLDAKQRRWAVVRVLRLTGGPPGRRAAGRGRAGLRLGQRRLRVVAAHRARRARRAGRARPNPGDLIVGRAYGPDAGGATGYVRIG
jgi:flagellar capping protein FliD